MCSKVLSDSLTSFSFEIFWKVFAVMLGGISVMTCHVTLEQLTKYILYCEWMIYATWRLVDSLSSLMQSIGATERVFQLMSLSPRNQYLLKGKHFVLYFRNCTLVLRSLNRALCVLQFINQLL